MLRVLDNTAATSTLEFPAGLVARTGELSVDIRHTWIGDLRVTLEHGPHSVVMHDRTGGSDDDLVETWGLSVPEGYDVSGPWRLKVADQATQDEGQLLGWSLTFRP
jgi:serine protease